MASHVRPEAPGHRARRKAEAPSFGNCCAPVIGLDASMCGLYSFRKSAEETGSLFDYLDTPDFPPRTYVAPGGPIAIVRMEQGQAASPLCAGASFHRG